VTQIIIYEVIVGQMIQLDLFIEKGEPWEKGIYEVKEICKMTRESSDKVRKKLFAENGTLKKEVMELKYRLEIIEKNICKGETCEF
jgi:hypothetical protein